jgi:hypothetical protein
LDYFLVGGYAQQLFCRWNEPTKKQLRAENSKRSREQRQVTKKNASLLILIVPHVEWRLKFAKSLELHKFQNNDKTSASFFTVKLLYCQAAALPDDCACQSKQASKTFSSHFTMLLMN